MNEPTLLDFLRRHWDAIVAIVFIVWAVETAFEGKSFIEALAGPLLVCAYLGVVFLLDRWVQWMAGTAG